MEIDEGVIYAIVLALLSCKVGSILGTSWGIAIWLIGYAIWKEI